MRWQYRTTVLALCLLAFFVTYFARMAISPVIPFIADDFDVTNTQIGFALSGMWLAYGLSQFPSGVLGDRFGEKRVILVAVGGPCRASGECLNERAGSGIPTTGMATGETGMATGETEMATGETEMMNNYGDVTPILPV